MGALSYVQLELFSCFKRVIWGIKEDEVYSPFILHFSSSIHQLIIHLLSIYPATNGPQYVPETASNGTDVM